MVKRDWVLIVAVVLVAASTVIASFTAQSGLGELAGWTAAVNVFGVELRLSWLLPLTVDAYGVGATRIATNKRAYSAEVRRQAFGHALAAVAVSVVANAVFHLIEADVIVLGDTAWVLVVAVSIVPPVALGGLAHLLSVAARDEVEAVAVPASATAEVETVTAVTVEAVPAHVNGSTLVADLRQALSEMPDSTIVEKDHSEPAVAAGADRHQSPEPVEVHAPPVPEPVPAASESVTNDTREESHGHTPSTRTVADLPQSLTAVPDPFAGVPPQLEPSRDVNDDILTQLDDEPPTSDQVQPDSIAPLYPLALSAFLSDVAGGEVPSVRTIKTTMNVGTDNARKLRTYLGGLVEVTR
ncbi:hypothetical protein ITP53_16465 [Nonomuraea sp. K274]|uniref:DUF2637 domain-containing protein n=1 Tax=Nonomuraea cypriaca TaxID=1187855 RepID=A0A931F0N4_9ACTN|nr:hypothetical protein [Nonomuraea cypriaca]MBF8187296.1 hypothetical protein [Nonomuraea cypriaca]